MSFKKILSSAVVLFIFICAGHYLYNRHLAVQARFNVEALARYVRSHDLVTGEKLSNLSQLPDVRLVAYADSLTFDSKKVKFGAMKGYFYHFDRLDERKFFVVASPINPSPYTPEFGMAEDLNLRVNFSDPDPDPDSYEEVKNWQIIPSMYYIITEIERS